MRYETTQKLNDQVDVRYFGLFFALQLFYQRTKTNFNIDSRDKNPSQINNYFSPMSSPRGKGQSSVRTGSNLEFQIILNFIKTNLKLFLRLIASDIHSTDTSLNSNEFNTLRLFFKIPNEGVGKSVNLSVYAPFFANFSSTTKVSVDVIHDWLVNMIYSQTGPINMISVNVSYAGADIEDFVQLKNLSKCVTLKENLQNKNVKISQCEDSYIFINSNVANIKISNCNNCTIFVASSKITTIDKCENCMITTASYLLRVSNTIDSTIFTYSIYQPILFGDNQALNLAPHNVIYNDFITHLRNANFPNTNVTYINNFSNPINLNILEKEKENENEMENINYSIVAPKDFTITVVPFNNNKCGPLLLTPKDYVEVINERDAQMLKLKSFIKEANLGEDQEKALHVAIQGYFREWLVSSGNIKNLTDIVKMIDVGGTTGYGTNYQSFSTKDL